MKKIILFLIIISLGLSADEGSLVTNNISQNETIVTPIETTTSTNNENELSFYNKAILQDPIMQIEMDALDTGLEQHVYKVREGSIGGYDSAGGACGCN